MSGLLSPNPIFKAFDNNGNPLAFGLVYTYQAGTTTPAPTYVDSTLATANSNPIVLNFRGECEIWIPVNTAYKFNVTDANGNQIPGWPQDQIQDQLYVPTQASISQLLNPVTAAEAALSITPTNYLYNPDFLDPRRYGAVGDGVTDDTGALNTWISVVNEISTLGVNPVSTWFPGLTYLCGQLNNITATNFTWNCWSTLKSKPNSITGVSIWLQISSPTIRIYGLTMNGNQANYSASVGNDMLYFSQCSDILLDGCTFINSWLKGVAFYQCTGGRIANCHFDSNANLGIESITSSYLKFINCTFNYNGYGFQKTLATNAFAAFGVALRFRSHHFSFIGCHALQNGRDGFCTNQGSYAIKYVGSVAWMNGDGGFTIASDSTSPGTPGDGESCYDLEYVDCEAYNNWSSGLSAYAPAYNVTVDGGRYYDNNRCAGIQSAQSSYFNGVYFSPTCLGIRVRTKAYDDRQLCPITGPAVANVIPATGWVAGTMANYPRVAFYNTVGTLITFQGYGTITAESAGSVTVVSTAFNGVVLANVAAGWFITQRVQHNGVFLDNSCQGTIDVDGFGFMVGPAGAYTGLKSCSGYFGTNQNVLLPAAPLDYTELLANPTWDASTGSGTSWTYNLPTGAAANYYTTAGTFLRSPGCLQLIGGTSAPSFGDGSLITSGLAYAQGCYVEASVWAYSANAGDSSITFFWNPGGTGSIGSTVTHPGGGWKQLKIGIFVPANNTQIDLRVISATGKTNYFDNATVRVKVDETDNRDFFYPTRNLAA